MRRPEVILTSRTQFDAVRATARLLVADGLPEVDANDLIYQYYELHHGNLVGALQAVRHYLDLRAVARKSGR